MTKGKGFKRFVRRRAAASGESYQRTRQRLDDAGPDVAIADVLSNEDRAHGRRLADLALRMADGKPPAGPPMWPALPGDAPPPEAHLVRVVARNRNAVVAAQQICRDALERNPRDGVARDALAMLERAEVLARSGD
jgi:hypothetical protein